MTATPLPNQLPEETSARPWSEIRATSQGALSKACSTGDLASLISLIDQERNEGVLLSDSTLLALLAKATRKRHASIVRLLLDYVSTPDLPHELIYSAVGAGIDIYKLYLAKNRAILSYDWQGIGDVVCSTLTRNEVEFLSYLLSIGADPGRSLSSARIGYIFLPLEFTAFSSTVSNARLLLQHGAVIIGTEAVQMAAEHGRLDMVQLLIEAGGNPNAIIDSESPYYNYARTYGTPLHNAVSGGHLDVAKFLLESGADIKMRDTAGNTTMMRAQAVNSADIIALLHTYNEA